MEKAIEAEARPVVTQWLAAPYGTPHADRAADALYADLVRRAEGQKRHTGEGTALKPAWEPIVLARKPPSGTVAQTVLEHGTGALNIDGCRVGFASEADRWRPEHHRQSSKGDGYHGLNNGIEAQPGAGRWPANVIFDEQAAEQLDEQSGERASGKLEAHHADNGKAAGALGAFRGAPGRESYGDSGGTSRFFYVAKAGTAEREAGLEGFEAVHRVNGNKWTDQDYRVARGERPPSAESGPRRNVHPTVKPIDLMRHLIRLVTPPGGTVLDPFCGSGTTGAAAALEGFEFIGIERDEEYAALAEARIRWWSEQPKGIATDKALKGDKKRSKVADTGQLELLG